MTWTFMTFLLGLLLHSTSTDKAIPKLHMGKSNVVSTVRNQHATGYISQSITNPANVFQEYSFTVFLPESIILSIFSVKMEGKVYNLSEKTTEKDKEAYRDAVTKGKSAVYVEQITKGSKKYNISVNIAPHATMYFDLKYEGPANSNYGVNMNSNQFIGGASSFINSNNIQISIGNSADVLDDIDFGEWIGDVTDEVTDVLDDMKDTIFDAWDWDDTDEDEDENDNYY